MSSTWAYQGLGRRDSHNVPIINPLGLQGLASLRNVLDSRRTYP